MQDLRRMGLSEYQWNWETTDPRRSGGAGDLAKLFKNELVKYPGVLAIGAPRAEATLMAREVIQNSWDAASEFQAGRRSLGREYPAFGLTFEFSELSGASRVKFAEAIDLNGLAQQARRASDTGDVTALGMRRTSVLDHATDPEQLIKVLRIVESGTTGMYGPFDRAKSKMFLALISLGYTVKASGSGGSYGYGKAGLIAGSATRTVIAYSCFEPRDNDKKDGVPITRRLLGMTYWGQHAIEDVSHTGFGRLGAIRDGWSEPWTNEDADRIAASLGMDLRSADDDTQLGTTFVLLDPVVEPGDLLNAIERNWWPAIQERRFVPIVVEHLEGEKPTRLVPRPLKNPVLAPFVRAHELATTPQDNDVAHEFRGDLGELSPALGRRQVGQIGIVADLEGWSYAVDKDEVDDEYASVRHTSLIALTRSPLMVVEYLQPFGTKNKPPFVRGVFIADEEIDDLLRQTEPKAHDAWVTTDTDLDDGVDRHAPKVASHVLKEISKATKKFQQRLRPPLPKVGDVRLSTLASLFRSVARGDGRNPPPPPPDGDRNVSVRTNLRIVRDIDGENIRAAGSVKLMLADSYKESDAVTAKVRVVYRFIEDGRAGEAALLRMHSDLFESEPDDDGFYRVELNRKFAVINLESEKYSPDWTGRLMVTVHILKPVEMVRATS
jgi:hypothetical protein